MQDLSSLVLEPMLFAVEAQGVLTTGQPGKCLYFKRKYVLFKKKRKEEASKTDRENDIKEI